MSHTVLKLRDFFLILFWHKFRESNSFTKKSLELFTRKIQWEIISRFSTVWHVRWFHEIFFNNGLFRQDAQNAWRKRKKKWQAFYKPFSKKKYSKWKLHSFIAKIPWKWLIRYFHEIFFKLISRFSLMHTVEKWIIYSHWNFFRQINYIVILIVKPFLSRNFCQKNTWVGQHSVEKREILSHTFLTKISWK